MKMGPIGLVLVGGANEALGAFRRRRLEGRRSNIYMGQREDRQKHHIGADMLINIAPMPVLLDGIVVRRH